jgi:hypothetical protein
MKYYRFSLYGDGARAFGQLIRDEVETMKRRQQLEEEKKTIEEKLKNLK